MTKQNNIKHDLWCKLQVNFPSQQCSVFKILTLLICVHISAVDFQKRILSNKKCLIYGSLYAQIDSS